LADTLVADNIACDICAAALDQCGIAEMRQIPESTGGSLVLTDTFVCPPPTPPPPAPTPPPPPHPMQCVSRCSY
jgi:hypothetical protein